MSQTIDQVYSDYNVQGVPASGEKKPSKAEIRALLKMIQNSGGQAVTRNTLSALNGVTPPNENYMGIVLTGSDAGYYYRSGGAWVFGRGFPDSVTVWTQTGGTSAAYQVAISAGVDPSSVALAVFTPADTNSAGATVNVAGVVRPILSATGAPIAAGELLAGRAAILVNAADGWRVVSSQSRMTFRGAWSSGTVYDRDDLAESGGSVWIAKRANTGVTPTEGADWTLFLPGVAVADGAVTFAKLNDTAYDWPKAFGAGEGGDAAANDAAFASLRFALGDAAVDMHGRSYTVSSVPSGRFKNGFWAIDNYEGGLSLRIPASPDTLPVSKTTLISTPGHSSWPEDSGWYWSGRKGVGYTSSNHQTGDRFVGFTQHGSIDHWRAPVADFGRDQNDAPNGFWHEGLCVIRGIEFKLVRRQAAGGSYPTDHRIYARNLDRWIEATDVVQSQSGSANIRLYKADLPEVEILEGTKVTVVTASNVGGRAISAEGTVGANNSLFIEINVGGSNFSSTETGGGLTQLKIPQSGWVERTFAGGASLGEALVANGGDDTLLTYQPAVCLGLAPIPSDVTGAAYLTAGGGYGIYAVKVTGLCAGVNEAVLSFAKKQTAWGSYAEPTVEVSQDDENVVYIGLRSDSGSQSPAIAITQDGFATQSVVSPITAAGGWALDNPLPCCTLNVGGEEYVFFGATGNRGGNTLESGWDRLPVYLLYASKADLLAVGGAALRAYKIGEANFFDMWADTGSSGRSGLGVGTMIALPGNRVEFICGDMQPNENWDKPQVNVVSYLVDVSSLVGGESYPVEQTVEQGGRGYLEWTGLSGDITTGNIFAPINYGVENFSDALGTDGIFVVPRTGHWRCTVSMMLNGTGSEQSAILWDEDTAAYLALPAHSGDLNSQWALFRANLPSGTNMSVTGTVTVYLRAGQRVSVKTGANTTAKSTTIQNLLRWEMVA